MEIPPSVAEKCLLTDAESAVVPGVPSPFAQVVALLTQHKIKGALLLSERDFGRIACTSRELNVGLRSKPFWLSFLQLQLTRVPQRFSVLRLFALLYAQRKNPNWKRELLTTAVSDAVDGTKVVRVHVSTSQLETREFWRGEFVAAMGLASFPTTPQAEELLRTVEILHKRGVTGAELLQWVAALEAKKRNKVLVAVLVKHLATHAELGASVTADAIAAVLDTMRVVLDVAGLLYLVSLDELRKEKWTLAAPSAAEVAKAAAEAATKKARGKKGVKGKRVPPKSAAPVDRPTRPLKSRVVKAFAVAMSRMTWLQLSDMFGPNKGLSKTLFAATHMMSVLERARAKAEAAQQPVEGIQRAQLALLCLRGCRYPASADGWAKYRTQVQEPLQVLDETNPLVKVDRRFLDPAYQPALAGTKLKVPHSRTVDAVLSQDGNSCATWDHLLNTRGTTAANVFSHWRSLVLLGYDADKLQAFLEKRIDGMDLFKLMGVRQTLIASFEPGVFATVRNALDAQREGVVDKTHPRAEGGAVARVVLGERTFQDKAGKSTKQVITRSVTTAFGPGTFQKHLRVASRLCGLKMAAPTTPAEGTAVIFVTNELLNALRKGTPPSVPPYSRATLWRNEALCLSELSPFGTPPLTKVRAGITWCQKPGGKDCDLDLSVTLFSKDWQQLQSCSYSNKTVGTCIQHSGDVRTAPHPTGAREAIEIDLVKLRVEFPTVAFVVMQVYSYSGVPYEDLADGSVFLADPSTPGDGPGGQSIISAARMTGAGTNNIASFLHFDAYGRTHFFNVDQTLNTESRSTTSGAGLVGSVGQTIYDDRVASTPKTLRGIDVSSICAAVLAKRVLIVHGDAVDPINKMAVTEVVPQDNAFDTYVEINRAALAVPATHSMLLPTELLAPLLEKETRVTLMHGALPEYNRLVQSLPLSVLNAPNRRLTTINVGVDVTKRGDREVPGLEGVVDAVQGPGALELLVGLSEPAAKDSAAKKPRSKK